ncbi:MAG: DUF2809 domain-containing protein [Bacteroidetes bacterium]|nr:DUF2809 domain-containing protein [Bacteroidota bacterium]
MLKFNRTYFLLSILLFIIEVLIALYVHDAVIRPYIGDVLVVVLLYCMLRSIIQTSVWKAAIAVLIFAYCIETLQYFNFVEKIGLQQYKIARVVIGNSFEWLDIAAYTAGSIIIIAVEKLVKNKE